MSEQRPTSDQAFYPKLRQDEYAQGEAVWQDYLDNRPYKDESGAVIHPGTGREVDPDQYFDQIRASVAEEEGDRFSAEYDYENMSVPQLARRMAHAEYNKDETLVNDISDALNGKLDELDDRYFNDDDNGVSHSTRPENSSHGKSNNDIRSERLEARVAKIRERALEELKASNGDDDDQQPTEKKPVTEVKNTGNSKKGSRYARFKRGVRRHLYEAPVKETPMGPAIEPDVPFDEWYEEKLAKKAAREPGRISNGLTRLNEKAATPVVRKVKEVAARTAEHTGNLTDVLDYIGNVALIDTAYYAGSAYARVHDRLEDAKIGITDKAKKLSPKDRKAEKAEKERVRQEVGRVVGEVLETEDRLRRSKERGKWEWDEDWTWEDKPER